MNIDLALVDYLIISHGHVDHGGGLEQFLRINNKADIFMHKKAKNRFYTKLLGFIPYYVGLDRKTVSLNENRIHFINHDFKITDEILLLENIPDEYIRSSTNKALFKKEGNRLILDNFKHELVLVVKESTGSVIFTACSHS